MESEIVVLEEINESGLEEKKAVLEKLKVALIEKELELTKLEIALRNFEIEYLSIVGLRYTELDELKAEYAELLHKLNPYDKIPQESARKARVQAQGTAETVNASIKKKTQKHINQTEDLKQLYREAAKCVHPDFATSETEREYRTSIMIEVNAAYKAGNEIKLKEIIKQWQSDEKFIKSNHYNAELAHLVLQIMRIRERLNEIGNKISSLKASDLYKIKLKAAKLSKVSRNLLREMAEELDVQIDRMHGKVNELRRKAQANG